MEPVEKMYNGRFFRGRHKLAWRAIYICNALIDVFKLKRGDSIIDIGCGIGDILDEFHSQGYKITGVEGSKDVRTYYRPNLNTLVIHDMREDIDVNDFDPPYNLALCLEMAEHIEQEYASVLVYSLCVLSDTIVLSAAPPGQKGRGHVNCQPPEYWINKFRSLNYRQQPHLADYLKYKWQEHRNADGIKAFYNNIIVFKRGIDGIF